MNKPLLGQREGTSYTQAVPLAPQKRGQISGYKDISHLFYQNDTRGKEGNDVKSVSFTELTSEPPNPLGAGLSCASSEKALSRGAGSHRTPPPPDHTPGAGNATHPASPNPARCAGGGNGPGPQAELLSAQPLRSGGKGRP